MDVPTKWINQWPTGWVRCPVYFGIPGLLRKESAPLKCLISCWVGMVQNWIIYENKNASFAYSKFVFLISQRNIKKMPQLCEASTNYMFSPPRGRQPISSTKSDGIWLPSPKLTQVGVERFVSAQIRRFSGSNCKKWGGYHDFSEKNWPFAANVPHFPHHFHLQDDAMENTSTEPESTDWCLGWNLGILVPEMAV